MNTPVLSAIIVSLLATTLFLLPLAIVWFILVFVPPERLAKLARYSVQRVADTKETPVIADALAWPATPPAEQRPNEEGSSYASTASRRPHRLGYFVIETAHLERTRLLVETFLERETKSWRLDGSTGYQRTTGQIQKSALRPSTLLYLVRFRRSSQPETVGDRLKGIGESSGFTVRLECDDDLIARSA